MARSKNYEPMVTVGRPHDPTSIFRQGDDYNPNNVLYIDDETFYMYIKFYPWRKYKPEELLADPGCEKRNCMTCILSSDMPCIGICMFKKRSNKEGETVCIDTKISKKIPKSLLIRIHLIQLCF